MKHMAQYAKHALTRGSGGMPPQGKFLKIALLRLNLEVILTENYKCRFCAGHLY